ncbi:MAG: thiol-disulfide isomerase [Candidatus Solibacter sp.]
MLRTPRLGLFFAVAAFSADTTESVTFNKDVLPVLQKNCQTCHRPGEVAPMPLLTYTEARPWAKAIKAAVLTRKMPPWFADPAVNHFSNDRSMRESDRKILAAWADAGAPEGNVKDAPPPVKFAEGWEIGKPDIVVEMPEDVQIPATGIVRNQGILVKVNFPKDIWVQAAEIRPSNRAVVHHMKAWVVYPKKDAPAAPPPPEAQPQAGGRGARPGMGPEGGAREILAKYNPGLDGQNFTVGDAAKFIPAGSDIYFETHYTTNGTATTDRTKVGIVLAKNPPNRRFFTSGALTNLNFTIPAGNPNYEVRTEIPVEDNVELTWIQPHMHMRGKDFEVRILYPTGETQTVLKVNGYNFNWQVGYEFAKPVVIPKGSKMLSIAHFDNSANNPFNPDPKRDVPFGSQTTDEMSVGFFSVVVNKTTDLTKLFGKASGINIYE